MAINSLAELFVRDMKRLRAEVEAYRDEKNLWVTDKAIPNSGGNLAMHLVGNLKTYIGIGLAKVPYERNREFEFKGKGVPRQHILKEIDEAILIVEKGILTLKNEDLLLEYPFLVWDKPKQMGFTLFHLLGHLNYHLGQINYHRRMLDV